MTQCTRVSGNDAALLMRTASAFLLEQEPTSECLVIALRGLALRLSGYRHQSFFGDWQHFVHTAYTAAVRFRRTDIAAVIEDLRCALTEKSTDRFQLPFDCFIDAAAGDEASRLLALAWCIVAGDTKPVG